MREREWGELRDCTHEARPVCWGMHVYVQCTCTCYMYMYMLYNVHVPQPGSAACAGVYRLTLALLGCARRCAIRLRASLRRFSSARVGFIKTRFTSKITSFTSKISEDTGGQRSLGPRARGIVTTGALRPAGRSREGNRVGGGASGQSPSGFRT